MDSSKNALSRLFVLSPIDAKDEQDEKYEKCYNHLKNLTKDSSEKEAHDILNNAVCKAAQSHEEVSLGLLTGILIDASSAPKYYRDLTFITRDGMNLVMIHFNQIILEKYPKLQDSCKAQLLWVIKEMIKNSVNGADGLVYNILRQISGGDVTPKNIWLVENMLDLLTENRTWLEKFPLLVSISVYTFLRLIVDHGGATFATLRQREVDFCISLLKEKFNDCMMIGRDLVRLLQNVARIPEFESLWKDIYNNPSNLSPQLTGVAQLLTTRTSRRFLQCRLTPDMEKKIVFLTSQVKFGQHKRYQDWFQRQFLSTPESQSLRCDLIRFICGVIHPSNEVLCSDIIPRWAVIGWLLTSCTSNLAATNSKLSLFYDWLFFDPEKDNIMNIEPAILVMYHSIRSHPAITATLLDFLCRILPNFYAPLAKEVRQGVFTSLRQILEKRVLPSLSPLFDNAKLDKELRAMIKDTFAEFCSSGEAKNEEALPPKDSPGMVIDGNHSVLNNNESETVFSEDEDDIPLGKLRSRDIKFRPIHEETRVDDVALLEQCEQLSSEIKKRVLSLQQEKDNGVRCEIMEKLLQAVLQEEDFDQEMGTALGTCLASLLQFEFTEKLFPKEIDDESIEDSIGAPLFVMFRNLAYTPEDDPSRQPLLMVMSEMGPIQPRLGYLLLYFLKVSKSPDAKMSSYRDYVKMLESKDLSSSLLNDLKLCQEDDIRMFCYLIPEIYTQFQNIAVGNSELLNLIVSCIDPTQLQDLICHILQGNMVMFKKDSFISVLNASLEWESFEQYALWQLIAAHNIPVDYIMPILPKLEFQAHAEALTSILLLLKKEKPTPDLLKHVLSRDAKTNDLFVVSVLKFWSQEHEEKLADFFATQLTKFNTSPNKRKRQQANKAPGAALEHLLAHLDELRLNCKQMSIFTQSSVQSALGQVQSLCTENQKTKYSDLFALTEEVEDIKTSKGSRARSRNKNAGKTKMPLLNSDSESNSSDEEEQKPKPPRKKKKMTVVGSDSD